MTTYRVCFDGKWQEKFDDQDVALKWAREVGETGRMVYVARHPNRGEAAAGEANVAVYRCRGT